MYKNFQTLLFNSWFDLIILPPNSGPLPVKLQMMKRGVAQVMFYIFNRENLSISINLVKSIN